MKSPGSKRDQKLQRFTKILDLTFWVVGWLLTSFLEKKDLKSRLMELLLPLKNFFLQRFKDRGVIGLIELVKPARQAFYLYLSGESSHKGVPGVAVDKEGIPILVSKIVEEIMS